MNAANICEWNLSNDSTSRGEKRNPSNLGVKRNNKGPLNNWTEKQS